ncbi:MAG: hypothetical protein NVV68_07365 [Dokdonella sp.]|nr:hypothetical protein [Dokdonella sp.]
MALFLAAAAGWLAASLRSDAQQRRVSAPDVPSTNPATQKDALPSHATDEVSQPLANASASAPSIAEFSAAPVDAPLAERIDALEAESGAGSGRASLQLYFDLAECAFLESPQARAALSEQHKSQTTEDLANQDFLLSRIQKAVKNCADVDPKRVAAYKDFLERAAEQGDPYAQLLYSRGARPSYQEILEDPQRAADYNARVFRYTTSAAHRCIPEALFELSGLYATGRGTARNPTMAYALYWVQVLLDGGILDPIGEQRQREGLAIEEVVKAKAYAASFYGNYCAHH